MADSWVPRQAGCGRRLLKLNIVGTKCRNSGWKAKCTMYKSHSSVNQVVIMQSVLFLLLEQHMVQSNKGAIFWMACVHGEGETMKTNIKAERGESE